VKIAGIRGKLLLWLVAPLLVLLAVGTWSDMRFRREATTRAYDQSIIDAAFALQTRVRTRRGFTTIDLPSAADEVMRTGQLDEGFYLVADAYGEILAGDPELPPPPVPSEAVGVPQLYDGFFREVPVRIVDLPIRCGDLTCSVRVAETTRKRRNLTLRLLSENLGAELMLALAALAVVWVGVGRGLAPLARLSAAIRERSPNDLRPIGTGDLPNELQPIVTNLNVLFDRVTEANLHQRRFTSNAAHQLRTPLAVLRTHLELAMVHGVPPSTRDQLTQAHLAVVRASHLVGQLLALARVDPGGGRDLNATRIDVADVVEALADEVVHRALERNIDLGFELAPAPIAGDALLVRESLSNLITNAIEYIPAGGRITLRSGQDGDRAFVEVEDDGPGIPPSERERVMERFYRMPDSPGIGSGLGLAIVREIVQVHGGTFAIHDGADGRGCRTRMEFPLAAAAFRAPEARTPG